MPTACPVRAGRARSALGTPTPKPPAAVIVQNPSADLCLALQFAELFHLQPALSTSASCSDPPGAAQTDRRSPGPARTGPLRNPMNAMAPTRPTELYWHCVPLTAGPAAAAEARGQVRAAICA